MIPLTLDALLPYHSLERGSDTDEPTAREMFADRFGQTVFLHRPFAKTMLDNNHYYRNQDLRFKMLTPEEETALWEKARAGDDSAREFLIHNHLLWAAMLARKLAAGSLPENEVLSAANFALMKAFERFDHTRGLRFTSFVRHYIRGEIVELWRDQQIVSYGKKRPSEDEDPTQAVLAEGYVDSEEGREEDAKRMSSVLQHAKGDLTRRELDVLRLFFEEGLTCADVGRLFKMTRAGVGVIKGRALGKMKKALARKGVRTFEEAQ